jgi:hypothetical protein
MATVTGLTAEAMATIRDGAIVSATVNGAGHLILTHHDGSTSDVGSVAGPIGPTGPAGLSLSLIPNKPVLEVGMQNQIRAGHPLTLDDFATLCGLPSTPILLANLADVTNLGSTGSLVNKGAVAFGPGIMGNAGQAAKFVGATGQALYINDTGSSDLFRLTANNTGYSLGAWFRTAKRGTQQIIMSKMSNANSSATNSWQLVIGTSNNLILVHANGVSSYTVDSGVDVCDDRWHFGVAVFDGGSASIYVDGVLRLTGTIPTANVLAQPFNIGGGGGDNTHASTAPFWGSIDEAFVIQDVLTDDQVRLLYCAKIPHGYSSPPRMAILNVHRRRKGIALASSDFPSPPVRLYNLSDLNDLGSNNVPLTANPGTGAISQTPGPDGVTDGSRTYIGPHTGDSGTSAGLPGGTVAATLGAWFRTVTVAPQYIMVFGDGSSSRYLWINGSGLLAPGDNGANPTGPSVVDGKWHQVVLVLDPLSSDGLLFKTYLDGKLVASSTASLSSVGLGGAGFFRIGANVTGGSPYTGQIARAFVHASALTAEQIRFLYNKSGQDLGVMPKDPGAHIQALDTNNLYATFDALEAQNTVDLAVAA